MPDEVIKMQMVQIANRLLDEYCKGIQSQCMCSCVSRGDANKTLFAIRQSARKLGNWDYISEAYDAYEAVMEALLLAVKYEMDKTAAVAV